MDLEKQIKEIEALGNEHIGTSPETPLRPDAFEKSDMEKIALIKKDVERILETLGMDLTDDSLKGTPNRVAKMFVQEIYKIISDYDLIAGLELLPLVVIMLG